MLLDPFCVWFFLAEFGVFCFVFGGFCLIFDAFGVAFLLVFEFPLVVVAFNRLETVVIFPAVGSGTISI